MIEVHSDFFQPEDLVILLEKNKDHLTKNYIIVLSFVEMKLSPNRKMIHDPIYSQPRINVSNVASMVAMGRHETEWHLLHRVMSCHCSHMQSQIATIKV